MNMVHFDYYYGNEAEQFVFYRIPKILVTSPYFKKLSDSAKLLYGMMLDRMGLSVKNGWFDEENRAYIYFTVSDVMEYMCCGTEKATKLIAELDSKKGVGLIERIKRGQGKPARIYLKKFVETASDVRFSKTESQDFVKSKVKTFENRNSRLSHTESAEFRKSKRNDNKYNNINISNTYMSNINQVNNGGDTARWTDRYNDVIEEIKAQIEYDSLIDSGDTEIIDNIVNVMADVMIIDTPYYCIEDKEIPVELVRIRYRQINRNNLESFLLEFKKIYYKIHNPKAFLVSALYNAALTADTALLNRVSHDLYGGEKFE